MPLIGWCKILFYVASKVSYQTEDTYVHHQVWVFKFARLNLEPHTKLRYMRDPHHGGPTTTFPPKGCYPIKGASHIKQAHESWDLVPHPGTLYFSRTFSLKKFRKVLEHFRHPPKSSGHVLKPFWLDGLLRNNFSVVPKLFGFSLWNIFGVSETFPVTFSQTPCLVLSR